MTVLLLLTTLAISAAAESSTKRGLAYVGSNDRDDIRIWTRPGALTWYYNFDFRPSRGLTNSKLEYVPMLWGAVEENDQKTFYQAIKSYKDSGQNITHTLGFNEPDEPKKTGGSSMSASDAASIWIREMEPVRGLGVKVGAPAVTGSGRGLDWMKSWLESCKGKCHYDFIPVHWYGPFEGLAGHIGAVRAQYPTATLWVTEFGIIRAGASATIAMFNQSVAYLDKLEYVERYSYFGAFRSDASNIGPDAAMLSKDGGLTEIGSLYVGEPVGWHWPGSASQVKSSGSLLLLSVLLFFLHFSVSHIL